MSEPPQVFINCPFDKDYRLLFRALVFTVLYLDHDPVFSETRSSDHIRVKTILRLIRESKFGIHDLSRNKSTKKGQMPRFNMPFELGLDIGSKSFGGTSYSGKRFLVLDNKPHGYKKYLSDISGQDIAYHRNSPERIIGVTRDWFARNYKAKSFDGPTKIWNAFNQFNAHLPVILAGKFTEAEVNSMQVGEWKKYARDYISPLERNL